MTHTFDSEVFFTLLAALAQGVPWVSGTLEHYIWHLRISRFLNPKGTAKAPFYVALGTNNFKFLGTLQCRLFYIISCGNFELTTENSQNLIFTNI